MSETSIFGPFFAMMVLTFVVWVYMYIRRISFIRTSNLSPKALSVPGALALHSPAVVSNPSDNLKNLFELPVLFYAVVLYLFAVGQVDGTHVGLAWVFAVFRILHSAVHCTVNLVLLRFNLYLVSALALFGMVGRAALAHLGG